MKSDSGRNVEVEVRVMHSMHSPKYRHRMKHHVLQVNHEIENHDRRQNGQPNRHVHRIEKSPSARAAEESEANCAGGKNEPKQRSIYHYYADVRRPSCHSSNCQLPARRKRLPCRHRKQHSDERAKPYEGLVRHPNSPGTNVMPRCSPDDTKSKGMIL